MDLTEEERIRLLKSQVDALCDKIRKQSISSNQARLEAEKIRSKAKQLFPRQMDKFDLIYKTRFQRLISQFLTNE